jgi:hypothetical protein
MNKLTELARRLRDGEVLDFEDSRYLWDLEPYVFGIAYAIVLLEEEDTEGAIEVLSSMLDDRERVEEREAPGSPRAGCLWIILGILGMATLITTITLVSAPTYVRVIGAVISGALFYFMAKVQQ